jgi:hypothetical protein
MPRSLEVLRHDVSSISRRARSLDPTTYATRMDEAVGLCEELLRALEEALIKKPEAK